MAEWFGIVFFVACVGAVLGMVGWAGWHIGHAVGTVFAEITYRR